MLGNVEEEIFLKYKNALVAIGVDLAEDSLTSPMVKTHRILS